MVRAEPEVQGIMGAEEFGWGGRAAVLPNHEGGGAVTIMDLQEVKSAGGAVLQIEEREGDPENLRTTDGENKVKLIFLNSLFTSNHSAKTVKQPIRAVPFRSICGCIALMYNTNIKPNV